MYLSSEAIVLNSIKYGDRSIITKLYCREEGIISIITNRSKSKRNTQHTYLQPFALLEVITSSNRKSKIKRLKEARFSKGYALDDNIVKGTIRLFIAELISRVIHEEEKNPQLFDFLRTKSIELNNIESFKQFPLLFLAGFCTPLGIKPNLENDGTFFDMIHAHFSNTRPEHSQVLVGRDCQLFRRAFINGEPFVRSERKEVLLFLLNYIKNQFGQDFKLKSFEVLEAVFE